MHPSPGMGAGHMSPTGCQEQLPHTCGQEVTVAQGSHSRDPVWLLQALGILFTVRLPSQHQRLLLRQPPQG